MTQQTEYTLEQTAKMYETAINRALLGDQNPRTIAPRTSQLQRDIHNIERITDFALEDILDLINVDTAKLMMSE